MATREGFVNCFSIDEVRPVGRNAMGVCGMRFKVPGDRVCGFAVEAPDAELLFVTENGRGKRSAFSDFRETHRGSMGVIGNPRESEKNGKLVGIAAVKGDETLVLLATNGLLIRTRVSEVRTMGRTAAGVNFVRLQEGASLATFSLAPAEEPEPETPTEAPAADPPATEAPGEAPAAADENAPTEA